MSSPFELDFSGRDAPSQTLRQAVQCLVDTFPKSMTLYDVEVESAIRFALRGSVIGATAAHLHAIADAARREDRIVMTEPVRDVDAAITMVTNAMTFLGATKAALEVLAERERQIRVEGLDARHDADLAPQELACAAAGYTLFCSAPPEAVVMKPDSLVGSGAIPTPICWPWPSHEFKPKAWRRDCVRAAALLLAALDLDDAQREAAERQMQHLHTGDTPNGATGAAA